jgi:hypothetical protein
MTTPASPAWLRIYRYFSEEPPPIGYVTTHDVLCQIAGLNWDEARHRGQYYHAVAKACIELENDRSRTLLTERGVGYRFVGGNAHVEKAITGALAVRRKLTRVAGTAATVDVTEMDEAEVDRVRHAQALILRQMESMNVLTFQPPPYYRNRNNPK